jgi:hypothetical protein
MFNDKIQIWIMTLVVAVLAVTVCQGPQASKSLNRPVPEK